MRTSSYPAIPLVGGSPWYRFELNMTGRENWRFDLGLVVFMAAGVAIARVLLGMVFGKLDGAGLMLCVAIGAGVGALLHDAFSQPRD